jgi:DNA-3-methyladenine glycosylase
MKKLPRSFYLRDPLIVARELLGVHLVRRVDGDLLVGKIIDVEAYLGAADPASHAYRGRTPRNEVMFGEGGHLYVYFTYGMHYCSNIVAGPEGEAGAVLLRGIEPVRGEAVMQRNRTVKLRSGTGGKPGKNILRHLTDGPAKLCEAFGIARKENGMDLLGASLYCTTGEKIPDSRVTATRRIGITSNVSKKWRFVVIDSPCRSA